ncbi:hypothetical protein [Phyllobacterium myrsinacearum]|uniref:Uncharacterized protein n=1 Tax=Phyllobacterium myrsinacearum TaxID=28101 RepID=A0A839EU02_9HYPH|nr:hypothetical protein [Phyllobacterium myrsinacearum]MBA8881658.1 hypothetical protein [Phyllobacterium myrsinacearum]
MSAMKRIIAAISREARGDQDIGPRKLESVILYLRCGERIEGELLPVTDDSFVRILSSGGIVEYVPNDAIDLARPVWRN